ncbi:6282_t:CDS:2 [Dentiscutata erythropus]|uniref:6282_t:CDS:1 n=1 Tax=Dentiscutata erythropus TaxID=1348616 RepID=A0A9N8ZYU8_9GLOM|nr:6282_t:CDS:2 [Dentiscutata erythropus]
MNNYNIWVKISEHFLDHILLYVGKDIKRLPAFRITFYYLLHIQAYQFYYLRFVPTIYTKFFPINPTKQYYPQQVVWIENGGEELRAPKLDYTLNDMEFIALSNFYKANLDENIAELNDWEVKYSKLRTKEGYMLGSLMSKVVANARNNSCVMYELETNIARPKDPEKYELRKYFGCVLLCVSRKISIACIYSQCKKYAKRII